MSKISGFPVGISDDVTLAYVGSRWVVICGGVAYGPFTQEHSEAVVWLYDHCPPRPSRGRSRVWRRAEPVPTIRSWR